jgi:hypothetical protein
LKVPERSCFYFLEPYRNEEQTFEYKLLITLQYSPLFKNISGGFF